MYRSIHRKMLPFLSNVKRTSKFNPNFFLTIFPISLQLKKNIILRQND